MSVCGLIFHLGMLGLGSILPGLMHVSRRRVVVEGGLDPGWYASRHHRHPEGNGARG